MFFPRVCASNDFSLFEIRIAISADTEAENTSSYLFSLTCSFSPTAKDGSLRKSYTQRFFQIQVGKRFFSFLHVFFLITIHVPITKYSNSELINSSINITPRVAFALMAPTNPQLGRPAPYREGHQLQHNM